MAVVSLVTGLAWAGAPGELSLTAGYAESESVDDLQTSTQSLAVRYVTGRTIGLRAELPLLRVRGTSGLLRTGAGPVTWNRRQGEAAGGGSPSGNGGNGPLLQGPGAGDPALDGSDWTSGVGDLLLAADRLLVGGGVRRFHVDAGVQVKAPTADEEKGLGTGEWDYRAGVSGEYRFWSVTSFGGAGWNWLGDVPRIELNDVWDAYLGLEGYVFGERAIVSGWIDGHQEIVDGSGSRGVIGLELRTTKKGAWRVALTSEVGADGAGFGVMLGRSLSTGGSAGFRGVLR